MEAKKDLLKELCDYVLMSSCSTTSPSLYYGRLGVSLSLFEANRIIKDDYLEDMATLLLEESLLFSTDNISFGEGLSGIGYVLLYLSKEKMIDLDFHDVFSVKNDLILNKIELALCSGGYIPESLLPIVYYLDSLKSFSKYGKLSNRYIDRIVEAVEISLFISLSEMCESSSSGDKTRVLLLFEQYLDIIFSFNRFNNSCCFLLIDAYSKLCRRSLIVENWKVGYYISKLNERFRFFNNNNNETLINFESSYFQNNLIFSLRDYIEMSQKKYGCFNIVKEMESYSKVELEDFIVSRIPNNMPVFSYMSGVSRILIYLSNPKVKLF